MITDESYPYGSTTESYDYAKEDRAEMTQVPYDNDGSSEETLEEEGPTECDCLPGEPGFAGFAGPKVRQPSKFCLYNFRGDGGYTEVTGSMTWNL